ncbi:hypothetical protein ACFL07_12320 [Pseudomonadota bacterium]
MKWWLILAPLFSINGVGAQEQPFPDLSAGGLLFGDLYAVPSNHSEAGDGAVGAVLRRGYLTFDGRFTKNAFGRMRFELNQSGEFETYDFQVSFKDLYLGWNIGRQRLLLGLSPTPTFDLIESIWGARYLARTPMDLQGVPSRDTGLSLKGPLNESGTLAYRFMMATKVNIGSESDDKQKWMGAISWKPADNWILDFYLDYEGISGPRDRTTIQGFAGYQTETFAWGIQYSNQDRQDDRPLELASTFIRNRVAEKVTLIGRVDRLFEPSPRANNISYLPYDPTARATTLFTGVEFHASPHFFVTPNIVYTHYDKNDEGYRPKSDLHLRLTLFIDFE